ncbi:ankyrin repeat domain-containing protein [Parasedimentitalea marina]|uniref:Ankyrin repeat domain-containing protein n=1 Tax=Parasedimentitalea marina TaxID=2483033 RepID=A0A3T0N780_9RHOB|nr:ankyrin repeat domain-containing protein [Parasedimentitalea marina]
MLAREEGNTSLHRAASSGSSENIEALLDAGADVNARGGEHGHTALHTAIGGKRRASTLRRSRRQHKGPIWNTLRHR